MFKVFYTSEPSLNSVKHISVFQVVGWGYTQEGKEPSAELKQLAVPFVHLENCFSVVPENFIRFLTADKFCAGFTNGMLLIQRDIL